MNMLKRISYKKPAISRESLEKDWRQNLVFMNNISSYPEDWYLRENNKQKAVSNPNLDSAENKSEKNKKSTASESRRDSKKEEKSQNTTQDSTQNTTQDEKKDSYDEDFD